MKISISKNLSAFSENSGWVLWSLFFFFAGLLTVVDPSSFASTITLNTIDEWMIRTYGATMLAGGTLKLIGIASRSFLIERAGVALIMPALVISVYIFVTHDYTTNRTMSIILYMALGWALATRYVQLGKAHEARKDLAPDLETARKVLEESEVRDG